MNGGVFAGVAVSLQLDLPATNQHAGDEERERKKNSECFWDERSVLRTCTTYVLYSSICYRLPPHSTATIWLARLLLFLSYGVQSISIVKSRPRYLAVLAVFMDVPVPPQSYERKMTLSFLIYTSDGLRIRPATNLAMTTFFVVTSFFRKIYPQRTQSMGWLSLLYCREITQNNHSSTPQVLHLYHFYWG